MSKTVTRSARKPKALSIHLGLNAVSPAHYEGWGGPLAACEFDANDMAVIAKAKGMKPTVLLTKKGTRANVLAAIRSAAALQPASASRAQAALRRPWNAHCLGKPASSQRLRNQPPKPAASCTRTARPVRDTDSVRVWSSKGDNDRRSMTSTSQSSSTAASAAYSAVATIPP